MKIEFVRQENGNGYWIMENNATIYTAANDPEFSTKYLLDEKNKMISRIFPLPKKKLQLRRNYCIQTFTTDFLEIILKPRSLFFDTKYFVFNNDEYLIIKHIGYLFSIFRENVQIASFEKENPLIGSKIMTLICDDNLDKRIFCLLCIHLYSDFHNDGPLDNPTFNISFEAKRANKKWGPNSKG